MLKRNNPVLNKASETTKEIASRGANALVKGAKVASNVAKDAPDNFWLSVGRHPRIALLIIVSIVLFVVYWLISGGLSLILPPSVPVITSPFSAAFIPDEVSFGVGAVSSNGGYFEITTVEDGLKFIYHTSSDYSILDNQGTICFVDQVCPGFEGTPVLKVGPNGAWMLDYP